MGTENDSNYETVIIEGEVWAVTAPSEDTSAEQGPDKGASETGVEASEIQPDHLENSESTDTAKIGNGMDNAGAGLDAPDTAIVDQTNSDETTEGTTEEIEFDALYALTKLLVGGAIEGTSQLTTRLQQYEEAIRKELEEMAADGVEADAVEEDELVRLRYAFVGLIFHAQATFRRNVSLWAKIADKSTRATNRVTQPVTNSFLFSPARRRYQRLVERGEESLARWIADGRIQEPPSRELARMTYVEIVDEFIDKLAENPQLQAVITKQSLGVASDMRDEVRERTVTADNLMESLVRRILRRAPRAELPGPPPEVQRWAGLTLEEYRAQLRSDENKDKSS